LVLLYWEVGRRILERQQTHGWGAKVVYRLARDLKSAFPDMKGFSRANLLYMRAFAENYPDSSFVQQVAGRIPWFHNCILLDKVKKPKERHYQFRPHPDHASIRACPTGLKRPVCLRLPHYWRGGNGTGHGKGPLGANQVISA
jgi:predicted nuclease of restriction endonuclease-like (RecB) superfamily